MAGTYHNKVQKALIQVGHELIKEGTRFKKVLKEPALHIVHPTKRNPPIINYFPDVVFETKVRQLFVFEILDAESENEIIADLIQASLLNNCHAIIFITKSEEENKGVEDIVKTVFDTLIEEKGTDGKELPYYNVWEIGADQTKNLDKLVKEIKNYYLKGWY